MGHSVTLHEHRRTYRGKSYAYWCLRWEDGDGIRRNESLGRTDKVSYGVVSRTAGSSWRVPVGVGRQESPRDRSPSEGHARAQETLDEVANRIRPDLGHLKGFIATPHRGSRIDR